MAITYILLAAIFGAAPRALARFPLAVVGVVALTALAAGVAGIGASLRLYPWTDAVVALFALSAGVSIGRLVPPRRLPFAILLAVLAALDTSQVIAAGPAAPSAPPSAFRSWTMFLLQTPLGTGDIGFGDLAVLSAIGEHWRRRGGGVLLALAPGVLGLAAASAFSAWAYRGSLPLLGFVLGGWLVAEVALVAFQSATAE